jgi:hypothetical protein
MERSKTMRALRCVVLLAFAGCAGKTGGMMDSAGSGGSDAFANASGGTGAAPMQSSTGNPSTSAGSGGHSGMTTNTGSGGKAAPASGGMQGGTGGSVASGSGGRPASAGSGGSTPATSSGSGGTTGSAGMGGADDPFGLADAGLFDPTDPNAPPPAAGQCADAVCVDVFDCTLWHTDLVGVCNFTDCVDFVCVQ